MNEMLSSSAALLERLRELTVRMGLTHSDTEWIELTKQSLRENNLRGDEPVPNWLIDFVQCFIEGGETESIDFQQLDDDTNIQGRYIGFIGSIIGGEWEDEGEIESVALDSINMQGFIYHEGSSYYVTCY